MACALFSIRGENAVEDMMKVERGDIPPKKPPKGERRREVLPVMESVDHSEGIWQWGSQTLTELVQILLLSSRPGHQMSCLGMSANCEYYRTLHQVRQALCSAPMQVERAWHVMRTTILAVPSLKTATTSSNQDSARLMQHGWA